MIVLHYQSADSRNITRDAATADELLALATERQKRVSGERFKSESLSAATAAKSSAASTGFGGEALGAALGGSVQVQTDNRIRARTPFSSGFLFTVQPETKTVQRKETDEKVFGTARAGLMKKMKESKGGAKLNPRAMDMALNGRNKT